MEAIINILSDNSETIIDSKKDSFTISQTEEKFIKIDRYRTKKCLF